MKVTVSLGVPYRYLDFTLRGSVQHIIASLAVVILCSTIPRENLVTSVIKES